MKSNLLSNLYRQVVLEHSKKPRNNKELENYNHQMELLNPSCGDMLKLQLLVSDDVIKDIGFTGYGCTISTASASMLTQVVKGKSVEDALRLLLAYESLIKGSDISDEERSNLEDASLLEGVKDFPTRYNCAILSCRAIEFCLSDEEVELEADIIQGGD